MQNEQLVKVAVAALEDMLAVNGEVDPARLRVGQLVTVPAEGGVASMEELRDADEVFACGTAAEVTPIGEIDGRVYDAESPLAREIAAVYARTVRGESSWSSGWLTEV